MKTQTTRAEARAIIRPCCKSLFLTSAIPEMVERGGTLKQTEYLAVALRGEVERRDENNSESFEGR